MVYYNVSMTKEYESIFDPNKCYFCGIEKPKNSSKRFRSVVEIHHIKERNEGGTNEPRNKVPCCSNHHSLIHENVVKLDKWYSTTGGWKLHWWDENGKEFWGPNHKKI